MLLSLCVYGIVLVSVWELVQACRALSLAKQALVETRELARLTRRVLLLVALAAASVVVMLGLACYQLVTWPR